ncbi:MAG: ribonuclease HII [Opitutaceae bacterium]|jgi:ribonuclease HII|nr:ribonuclease HII [Opitutaceae bacterium]
MKRRQLRGFDLRQINGFSRLIGVDEAGRGALAGPVVAAAVLVERGFLEGHWARKNGGRVDDSKQLDAGEREALMAEFEQLALQGKIHASPGVASVAEIEQLNILGATRLAMRRALEVIYPPSMFPREREPDLFLGFDDRDAGQPGRRRPEDAACRIIVDGLPLKPFPYPHTGIVKGDARSLCIAMASIIAKVTRDRLMRALDTRHPGYGFARHKGYGTAEHRDAVLRLGRCAEHRDAFLRNLLATRADPAQTVLFEEVANDK